MELGTLFLLRAADLYLKEGGMIAFVLPRSIFSSDQHDALRQGTFKGVPLSWSELWDLESVEPLFNVPACVLFGRKTSPPSPFGGMRGEVLDLPIPQFDPSKPDGLRVAELGKACSERVAAWLAAGGPGKTRSIGRLRRMVREMLREELGEIDECTTRILGTETRKR